MNNQNTKVFPALPAPHVPAAYPEDGLMNTTALNSPIEVEIQVWPTADTGHIVQLELNQTVLLDSYHLTENDQPGDVITLKLSPDRLISEGTYRLGYRTSNPNSDSYNTSAIILLKVDRTPPGAALLAPLIFNTQSGNHLTALLPGYAGMEPGDTIQTLCNGHSGPTHIVQPDELTLRPIEIVFEREVMQSLAADNVAISYTVTDRAGNLSIESLPVTLSLNM